MFSLFLIIRVLILLISFNYSASEANKMCEILTLR